MGTDRDRETHTWNKTAYIFKTFYRVMGQNFLATIPTFQVNGWGSIPGRVEMLGSQTCLTKPRCKNGTSECGENLCAPM